MSVALDLRPRRPQAAGVHMPRQQFSLTRFFLVAGLATAVVVAATVAAFTGREVYHDLEDKSEDYAVLIANNLSRQVHERFTLPMVARDGFIDLERPEHLAALDEVVRLGVAEMQVRNVYFFDLEGRIIYSTQPEHRGFVVRDNGNYLRASHGEVSSLLVERGSPLDIDGQAGQDPLLETYVPIVGLDAEGRPTGQRAGVIEIYQDANELLRETRRGRTRMTVISTIGIVVLMAALSIRIRQAERTLDQRTGELLEANARLETLSQDLERQVDDRTRRLVRAETLASVGTLSAGVAHEINNPMASIASCAEGLLRRGRDPRLAGLEAFEEFPEYLQIIRDEAFRVKDITRNLLDFSRAGAAPDGPLAPVDLGALLQATARLVAYRCEHEHKPLRLDLPAAPVLVMGDAASLRQLLLNVTVNALDASPGGRPIVWRLRALDATREEGGAGGDGGGGAELVCVDQGKGLSSEELGRAFEPFFTRKPVGQGTGLGLAIAYSVARRHGGSIELESAGEGLGARVTVRLGPSPLPDRAAAVQGQEEGRA